MPGASRQGGECRRRTCVGVAYDLILCIHQGSTSHVGLGRILPHLLDAVGQVSSLRLPLKVQEAQRRHMRRLPRQHGRQAKGGTSCDGEGEGMEAAPLSLSLIAGNWQKTRVQTAIQTIRTADWPFLTRVQQLVRVQVQQPIHAVLLGQPERLMLAIPAWVG